MKKTRYLGGIIHKKHDVSGEVQSKIGSCFAILNRLNFFWKKANCPHKFKLNVFDAVVRAKLVYGLETIHLSDAILSKMDAFQLKGIRKILGIQTTYMNRANTNARVFERASAIANPKSKPNKNIRPFSHYVQTRQESLLKHIVRSPNDDPLRQCTLEFNRPLPFQVPKRRVGRPRLNWTTEAYKRIYIKNNLGTLATWKADTPSAIWNMEADIRNRLL
jgi:hypothetical protein